MTEDVREGKPERATPEMRTLFMKRRAFSDPVRLRMREVLSAGPRTVKRLGHDLGVDPNRLYYHLRILEEADLIEVVGTEASGRMVEKVYGAKGGGFGRELPGDDPVEQASFFSAILDAARSDLHDAVFEQARQRESGEHPLQARVLRGVFFATPDRLQRFMEDLEQLLEGVHRDAVDLVEQLGPEGAEAEGLTDCPITLVVHQRPRRNPDDLPNTT
jgi:DNA-binding transcriptional ArsR family regulator